MSKLLELVGLRDEVGFAVDLNQACDPTAWT
jgi:hypothetical protein